MRFHKPLTKENLTFQVNPPANESPAPPAFACTKKMARRPKELLKVGKKKDVDMVIDSNDKRDDATTTGLPEL